MHERPITSIGNQRILRRFLFAGSGLKFPGGLWAIRLGTYHGDMVGSASAFSKVLLKWYHASRRDLPWRPSLAKPQGVDPYLVLVSEFMLQQTQVVTVVPYFHRFVAAFPTVGRLAEASEQEVLRLWQGLGYYSRARNLQLAARKIVLEFGGAVPRTVEELMQLPGVGRYTAGAVASIAFGERAPIVDGNVARVLCRLDKVETDAREPGTIKHLWKRAEELLPARQRGEFNSAMMELGATICTPGVPGCLLCPVRKYCEAQAAGLQERIPVSHKSKKTPLFRRWTICLQHEGRWLIEQRPAKGRWASLWQFPTIEAGERTPTAADFRRRFGVGISELRAIGKVKHALTHRKYVFEAFTANLDHRSAGEGETSQKWVDFDELDAYPLSRPQLIIAKMIRQRLA